MTHLINYRQEFLKINVDILKNIGYTLLMISFIDFQLSLYWKIDILKLFLFFLFPFEMCLTQTCSGLFDGHLMEKRSWEKRDLKNYYHALTSLPTIAKETTLMKCLGKRKKFLKKRPLWSRIVCLGKRKRNFREEPNDVNSKSLFSNLNLQNQRKLLCGNYSYPWHHLHFLVRFLTVFCPTLGRFGRVVSIRFHKSHCLFFICIVIFELSLELVAVKLSTMI